MGYTPHTNNDPPKPFILGCFIECDLREKRA